MTPESAERGTAAHTAIQLFEENDLGSIDPSTEVYLQGYKQFKAETGFVPNLIEVLFWQFCHRYGTRIDLTGILNGREILLEIKTGAPHPSWGLQLALQNECLPKRLPRFALQLKPDVTYRLQEFTDPNDRNVALACCAIVHWKRNNGGKNGNKSSRAA